ncbi:MAG: (2Fe-2S)-binding protein [Pseudomonadales bacterium]
MKQIISLNINGETHEVAVQPYDTLLIALRDRLGLKAAKRGCDTGGCGCCSVHVDGKVVYSCMTFALGVVGKEISTVEGLATAGELDPLQQAFVATGAVQCGYCTCGIMMSAKQLLAENTSPSEDEIREGIAGNLCRCTGYSKIVDAIKQAASKQ